MLAFFDERLVILATPKTGSTSLAAVLESRASLSVQRPPALKHTGVDRYRRFLGPYLAATAGVPFEVVAVMREPRDWLGSWFRYRQRADLADPARRTTGLDFDAFVTAWCETPVPAFAQVGSQARFLTPKSGARVDLLFRHEAMDGLLDFLQARLKTRFILPHLNVSPPGDLSLSARTEARLREVAAADFALYAELVGAGDAPWGALAMSGAPGKHGR